MIDFSPEKLWEQHSELGLTLETLYVQAQLDSVEIFKANYKLAGESNHISIWIEDSPMAAMRPGAWRASGSRTWFLRSPSDLRTDFGVIPVIAAVFSLTREDGEVESVTVTGFSVTALLIKFKIWLATNHGNEEI